MPNFYSGCKNWLKHPELTRERRIRSLLFEIKRVFVYNSTVFRLTDLFLLYFFIPNVYANKIIFKIKVYEIMLKGSNCDRKSPFSEILTEPLNLRDYFSTGCPKKHGNSVTNLISS